MTDEIVNLASVREVREQKKETFRSVMDRKSERERILIRAIEEMRTFSSALEIAKTLRFALEILEGRAK